MSIASKLQSIVDTKAAIKTAINEKGGSITDSTPFADYATAITNLPSGGGGDATTMSVAPNGSDIPVTNGTVKFKMIFPSGCPSGISINVGEGTALATGENSESTACKMQSWNDLVQEVGSNVTYSFDYYAGDFGYYVAVNITKTNLRGSTVNVMEDLSGDNPLIIY